MFLFADIWYLLMFAYSCRLVFIFFVICLYFFIFVDVLLYVLILVDIQLASRRPFRDPFRDPEVDPEVYPKYAPKYTKRGQRGARGHSRHFQDVFWTRSGCSCLLVFVDIDICSYRFICGDIRLYLLIFVYMYC